MLASINARTVVVKGIERHSLQSLCFYYFGTGNNLDYLLDRIFLDRKLDVLADGLRAWSAPSALERIPPEADLAVADLPWPYYLRIRGDRFVEIPAWVEQQVVLGGTWASVLSGFRRRTRANDLRMIRTRGLTARFTSSEDDARHFYEHMYLPYIEQRFGDLAFSEPLDKVVRYATTAGRLLQIIRESRVVAAAVLVDAGRTLRCLWVGVKRSLSVKDVEGAVGALYYYPIRYGYEQGFDEIYFGYSRPVLNDGAYRSKRKWGATVSDAERHHRFLLLPRRLSPGVIGTLAGTAWLVSKNGHLVGKLLVDGGPIEQAALETLVANNSAAGIERLHVLATGGFTSEAADWASDEGRALTLTDLTTVTDPIATYCGG